MKKSVDTKEVMFYGIPKTYFLIGFGGLLFFLGYKAFNKSSK